MKFRTYRNNFDSDRNDEIQPFESLETLETLDSQELRGKLVECRYCDGSGRSSHSKSIGVLEIGSERVPCPACNGSGFKRV